MRLSDTLQINVWLTLMLSCGLQHTAAYCTAHCSTLQHTAAHCSTLAAHCSTLAAHYNTLQHTATSHLADTSWGFRATTGITSSGCTCNTGVCRVSESVIKSFLFSIGCHRAYIFTPYDETSWRGHTRHAQQWLHVRRS